MAAAAGMSVVYSAGLAEWEEAEEFEASVWRGVDVLSQPCAQLVAAMADRITPVLLRGCIWRRRAVRQ